MISVDPRSSGRVWRIAVLVLLAALLACGSARGDTFSVTLDGDPSPLTACDASCSLREAVIASNSNSIADTINMNSRTVTLAIAGDGENVSLQGDLDIGGNAGSQGLLTINNGTIVAGASFGDRIFHVHSGEALQLNNVSVRDGNVLDNGSADDRGGNIKAQGTLGISGGEVTGGQASRGGGMELTGADPVELDNVTVADNDSAGGGGISNGTELAISDSRFTGNDAGGGRGGGIDNSAIERLSIEGSHFQGNTATYGGALAFENGTDPQSVVAGTSLVGNTAVEGGGGVFAQATAELHNATVSGNMISGPTGRGGGIDIELPSASFFVVRHGTLAHNSAPLGADVDVGGGEFFAINALVVGTCHIGDVGTVQALGSVSTGSSCGFTGAGNLSGATVRLGPLTPAGSDMVLPLLGGSGAIDAGDDGACLPTDQRGVPRPAGECDAGSYEALKTDLTLALAAAPDGLLTGTDVTLMATVTNRGPRATGGILATLPLPTGAAFVSGSAGCSAGQPVICSLGALDPDGVAQAIVVARASAPGPLTFPATVVADLAGAVPGHDSASATVHASDPPAPPGADKRKPGLSIALAAHQTARRAARARRLKVRLTSDEACQGGVEARLGSRRLARVRGRSFKAAATTVTLRLARPAGRRLRSAKRVSLRATCADAAGNTATARRTVKLKR
jgi:hypothetical protein